MTARVQNEQQEDMKKKIMTKHTSAAALQQMIVLNKSCHEGDSNFPESLQVDFSEVDNGRYHIGQ